MKQVCHFLIALTGGLAWLPAIAANAQDIGPGGNPYAVVAVRNIFGLNPPAPANATPVDDTPPPKITPNGIMSIFGQLQVLFKVAPVGKIPKPGGDDAYILSEGQRQDDIEVVKINEKAGIVTFNNHGTVQELPLVAATPGSTSPPATPAAGANPTMTFRPAIGTPPLPGNNYNANRALTGGGGRFGGGNAPGNNGGLNNDPGLGFGQRSSGSLLQQPQNTMTVEESDAMIEVNRELTKQQVIEGAMPPLPPTAITPGDATGIGGGPQ